MKKAVCLLICAIIAFTFVSCSGSDDKTAGADTTSRGTPIKRGLDLNGYYVISTLDSSCFERIGYEESSGTVFVTFRESGESYIYHGISKKIWKEFSNADSLGQFFNEKIKDEYSCEKVVLR